MEFLDFFSIGELTAESTADHGKIKFESYSLTIFTVKITNELGKWTLTVMNHPRNSNLTKIKPHNSVYLRNYKFSSKNHAFSKKNRWRNFTFIWNFFLLTQCFLVNSLSADSIFFLSRKYIVWVIWKITKNLTAGGWQWSLARVVWWRPRASNSIRIVRSSSVFFVIRESRSAIYTI